MSVPLHAGETLAIGCAQRLTQDFFFRGTGVQQIQLRREGRENGDLGAVAS
jgi:hypothetical protein